METAEPTRPPEQQPQAIPPPSSPPLGELDATLDHLERLCGRLETAEIRFKQLTAECETVLHGLVAVDRTHSSAVASLNERLGEWCNLEGKLLQESARRIEQFERGVGHEWMVIRQMHEEPIAELKDQAAQLRLACLEAARLARFRLDSAEQAYSAYAADLERRMGEWSRELLKAARSRVPGDGAERALPPPPAGLAPASSPVEPWPLEGVAQLHQELRTRVQAGTSPLPGDLPRDPGAAVASTPASESSQGVPADGQAPTSLRAALSRKLVTRPAIGAIALGLIVVSVAVYAWRSPASPKVMGPRAAPAAATTTIAASAPAPSDRRTSEDKEIVAQREAERLGAFVEILAAPDLRRYALAGVASTPSGQPYGQILWSRSRGLAASASRLAPLPDGKVYQLWIVPDGPAVAAGVLVPDAAGRASLVLPGPLKLPLPVTISVTLEDQGQTVRPRGPVCLIRVSTS